MEKLFSVSCPGNFFNSHLSWSNKNYWNQIWKKIKAVQKYLENKN